MVYVAAITAIIHNICIFTNECAVNRVNRCFVDVDNVVDSHIQLIFHKKVPDFTSQTSTHRTIRDDETMSLI